MIFSNEKTKNNSEAEKIENLFLVAAKKEEYQYKQYYSLSVVKLNFMLFLYAFEFYKKHKKIVFKENFRRTNLGIEMEYLSKKYPGDPTVNLNTEKVDVCINSESEEWDMVSEIWDFSKTKHEIEIANNFFEILEEIKVDIKEINDQRLINIFEKIEKMEG